VSAQCPPPPPYTTCKCKAFLLLTVFTCLCQAWWCMQAEAGRSPVQGQPGEGSSKTLFWNQNKNKRSQVVEHSLACVRSWVQASALQKKKITTLMYTKWYPTDRFVGVFLSNCGFGTLTRALPSYHGLCPASIFSISQVVFFFEFSKTTHIWPKWANAPFHVHHFWALCSQNPRGVASLLPLMEFGVG
jgi:hypothetical protein